MRLRRSRMGVGLICAVGMACIFAVPAMAHQFTASRLPKPLSPAEPGKTKGVGVGSSELGGEERGQEFKFGVFNIYCSAKTSGQTVDEGAVTWATSQVFATEVKFEKCLTKVKYANWVAGTPTKFNVNPSSKKSEPLKFVYHANGFADFGDGATSTEAEVGAGSANFMIGGKVCTIGWPSQVVPVKAITEPEGVFTSAVFSTREVPVAANQLKKFPSGLQQKLVIENNFKFTEWKYEEGQCLGEGGFEEGTSSEEGKSGSYKGTLLEEVSSANLGFE